MGTSKSYKGGATPEKHGKTNQTTQTRTRTTAQGTVMSGYAEGEKHGGGKKGKPSRGMYGSSEKD